MKQIKKDQWHPEAPVAELMERRLVSQIALRVKEILELNEVEVSGKFSLSLEINFNKKVDQIEVGKIFLEKIGR